MGHLETAFELCIRTKQGLRNASPFLLPNPLDLSEPISTNQVVKGWKKAVRKLKIDVDAVSFGAKTPKMSFLNMAFEQGTPSKEIHTEAGWGSNSDIRRFYIKSEAGNVALDTPITKRIPTKATIGKGI